MPLIKLEGLQKFSLRPEPMLEFAATRLAFKLEDHPRAPFDFRM